LTALLAYREDEAGGLMNPRFIRLRPDVSVDVAIRYLRAQAKRPIETIHYLYVLDIHQRLLGVLSFRDLIMASTNAIIKDIMKKDIISVPIDKDQEEISRIFSQTSLAAIPVVNHDGLMQGIITLDDVLEIVQEDATEDMQKMAGVESLDTGYLQTRLIPLIKKRAFWLSILFIGEMFTATAMRLYETELEKAVVLAMFIPLIISSGGNSGSQATSLIMRALALGDLRLKDWFRVFLRELICGVSLGLILALLVWIRIRFYPHADVVYGPNFHLLALAVACAVTGVVLWGNLMGAMLPFILKSLRLDPATASAPLVATLVDVTGLMIYFTVAKIFLGI
jgi:magnesium transporter